MWPAARSSASSANRLRQVYARPRGRRHPRRQRRHDALEGEGEVSSLSSEERKRLTLAVQMIFQDPMSSLNRMRVADIVGEARWSMACDARRAGVLCRRDADPGRPRSNLQAALSPQFSGGQRAASASPRALAVKPEFLVCDESVAALDVSIQAQVLNLFMELRERLNLDYLFISHDLGVVQHISDRVVIMFSVAWSRRRRPRSYSRRRTTLYAGAPRQRADAGVAQEALRADQGRDPSPINPRRDAISTRGLSARLRPAAASSAGPEGDRARTQERLPSERMRDLHPFRCPQLLRSATVSRSSPRCRDSSAPARFWIFAVSKCARRRDACACSSRRPWAG